MGFFFFCRVDGNVKTIINRNDRQVRNNYNIAGIGHIVWCVLALLATMEKMFRVSRVIESEWKCHMERSHSVRCCLLIAALKWCHQELGDRSWNHFPFPNAEALGSQPHGVDI